MNPQNPTPTLPLVRGGSEYIVFCLNKGGLRGVFQIFVQEVLSLAQVSSFNK
jgi:hypothetical protein